MEDRIFAIHREFALFREHVLRRFFHDLHIRFCVLKRRGAALHSLPRDDDVIALATAFHLHLERCYGFLGNALQSQAFLRHLCPIRKQTHGKLIHLHDFVTRGAGTAASCEEDGENNAERDVLLLHHRESIPENAGVSSIILPVVPDAMLACVFTVFELFFMISSCNAHIRGDLTYLYSIVPRYCLH